MTDSQQNIRLTARVGYEPHFSWSYLKPKYWGVWLGILALLLLAFVPFRLRDKLAAKLGVFIGHKAKKQRKRAQINLQYCFPQWTEQQREQVIDEMFAVLAQVMLGIGEIAVRSKNICKNGVNLSALNTSSRQKSRGKT